jgi:putative phage-type endonuclease
MNVIQVQQGSQEWLDLRKSFFTASEAPAALGKSKYQSRTDLLKQKATGLTEEVGNAKQKLFNRGHQSEADARPFAEMIVKTDLYPVTATLTVDGVNLLASLDGATMMEDEIFEHKLYSEALAADVRAGTLDPHYTIQMDQQLLVSGAKRCLFMTSDGTDQNMAWCWYESSQAKFDALIAGWQPWPRPK